MTSDYKPNITNIGKCQIPTTNIKVSRPKAGRRDHVTSQFIIIVHGFFSPNKSDSYFIAKTLNVAINI